MINLMMLITLTDIHYIWQTLRLIDPSKSWNYIFLVQREYYKHDFILYQFFTNSSIENNGL